MKQVFIIDGNQQYDKLFTDVGWELSRSLVEADLVCFTGGEDVSPSLYGDKKHQYTGDNLYRDLEEQRAFLECKRLNIPKVGICRG